MSATYLNTITDLMIELSTEIDLHYEDADLLAVPPSIDKLREAAAVLEAGGVPVPNTFSHLNARVLKRATDMAKIDAEGALLMGQLTAIIANEVDKFYRDEILLSECGHVFEILERTLSYMNVQGIERPPAALTLIDRFVDVADGSDLLEQF